MMAGMTNVDHDTAADVITRMIGAIKREELDASGLELGSLTGALEVLTSYERLV